MRAGEGGPVPGAIVACHQQPTLLAKINRRSDCPRDGSTLAGGPQTPASPPEAAGGRRLGAPARAAKRARRSPCAVDDGGQPTLIFDRTLPEHSSLLPLILRD